LAGRGGGRAEVDQVVRIVEAVEILVDQLGLDAKHGAGEQSETAAHWS
jgi:hypothetical protein